MISVSRLEYFIFLLEKLEYKLGQIYKGNSLGPILQAALLIARGREARHTVVRPVLVLSGLYCRDSGSKSNG